MSWIMHSYDHFTLSKGGYHVDVRVNGSFYPVWEIYKDGVLVDAAYYHTPVTSRCNKELACKANAEKYLNALIKQ